MTFLLQMPSQVYVRSIWQAANEAFSPLQHQKTINVLSSYALIIQDKYCAKMHDIYGTEHSHLLISNLIYQTKRFLPSQVCQAKQKNLSLLPKISRPTVKLSL